MAKDKHQKQRGPKGAPNRHLHARTTFLYQAATYLALQTSTPTDQKADEAQNSSPSNQSHDVNALRLGSHLRSISLKGQTRLSGDIKRSLCKTCNGLLIPGRTSTHVMENMSKDSKKPWANVLVVGCNFCGSKKRYPVGATRQQKKSNRVPSKEPDSQEDAPVLVEDSTKSPPSG